jgi:manganese/zinc/iron transport system substrate-binding protein
MGAKDLALLLAVVFLLRRFPGAHAEGGSRLRLVATTTMLADLARQIGGEHVSVSGLDGAGIDPHLYQASAGDVTLLQGRDVCAYNGLHLEGKMGELFEALGRQGRAVLCVADGLDEGKLHGLGGGILHHDTHVWFDVGLWTDAAQAVADGLGALDP